MNGGELFLFDEWAANTVGRMHRAGITGKMLAEECGFSNSYISTVLHCKKGDDNTRQRIDEAISRIEARKREGVS